jgi:Acetyltransferase (GNAT) domain
MTGEFIFPDDSRWAGVLARVPHDTYHLPAYSILAAKHEGGVPMAFYGRCGGREMLIPLLLRALPPQLGTPPTWRDACSAYGYPGPITSHPHDDDWLQECRTVLYELARGHDIIAAFVRIHPLRGIPANRLAPYGTVVEHGPIVYLDLTKGSDELNAGIRKNHRIDIQRLTRAGFTARMDDWSVYPAFVSMYRETMDRVAAEPFYYFSDQYFADLELILKGHLHISAALSRDGHVAAAGLFLETDGLIQYHLGGTVPAYLKHAPSKLTFEAVTSWGRSIGATMLNLGGGIAGHLDSLYQFKAGFSRTRALFHTLRMTFDEDAYGRLVRTWQEQCRQEEGGDDYFPIYRKPSRAPEGDVKACTIPHSNV